LTEKSSFANETPASLGMDGKGKDHKPIGTAKGSVNSPGKGRFEVA